MTRLRRLAQVAFLALFALAIWGHGANPWFKCDPLAALSNALATRALYRGLAWSLAVLIPTFFLGRFFCGWVCPLGTLNELAGLGRRPRLSRYRTWQSLKYYVLIAALVAAAAGSAVFAVADPLALVERAAVSGAFGVVAILAAILALNLRVTRWWCRALCPLGALLGAASRWAVLGLEKRPARCSDCNRCLLHCQGGDDPIPGAKWHKSECHLCLNCVRDCPEGGLRFRLFPCRGDALETPVLARRGTLLALAGGVAAAPLLRGDTRRPRERLIRPPGALDEPRFLARCIRCSECIKACPPRALASAVTEGPLEALWTPVLAARSGYCQPACTACADVCPTGAIWPFTVREKGWERQGTPPIRLGTAFYDRGRCLPWATNTECIVCEELCPVSPKAIYLRVGEGGIRQPWVDPARCVGCGACEYGCPLRERPAVYVTSAGESRSRSGGFLLERPAPAPALFPESNEAPGWVRTREPRSFAAADLWKYVDGDAERYLRAGIVRTVTADYRWRDTVDAVADVHVMGAPDGARAVMESEPPAGSRAAEIGDAARLYGASITFRKGRHFVRLVAFGDTPALEALAGAIAHRLR